MKDFLVWYSNDKCEDKFSISFTLKQLIKNDHLDYGSTTRFLNEFKVDSINESIGLKDINGNKIYADCSIVEFKWGQDEHIIKGYFTFNLEFLQYEIIMLNIQKGQSCAYSPFKCKDFKIIDTIQENKLGLIKE